MDEFKEGDIVVCSTFMCKVLVVRYHDVLVVQSLQTGIDYTLPWLNWRRATNEEVAGWVAERITR